MIDVFWVLQTTAVAAEGRTPPDAFWVFLTTAVAAIVAPIAAIATNIINNRTNLKRLEVETKAAHWRDEMAYMRVQQTEMKARRIAPKEAEIAALRDFAQAAYKASSVMNEFSKDEEAIREAKVEFIGRAGYMSLYSGMPKKIQEFLDFPTAPDEEDFQALMREIESHTQRLAAEIQQIEEGFAETRFKG